MNRKSHLPLSRLARWLAGQSWSGAFRYGIATLIVLASFLLRSTVPVFGLPYLLFVPVLMAVGFVFGLGPGLWATAFSVLLVNLMFVGERFSLVLTVEQWVAAGLFLLVMAGIVVVSYALRQSLARLQMLADSLERGIEERTRERDQIWEVSPDLICTTALDGRFLKVNPAWETVLGWSEAELTGRCAWDLVHPDDREATLRASSRLVAGELLLGFENRFRRLDGRYCWLSWNAVQRNGVVYATVRDITASKEQAQALRQTEELLRHSQKMEAVGQLTGGLAHDFNNLLTGITGSLDLAGMRLGQGRPDDALRYLETARSSANRAAAVTHRLLAFSRRQTLAPRVTEPNRLIEDMLELIVRTVGPTIEVRTQLQADLWRIRCDPHQLENALLNLCINARDAMPDGGCLTISTRNLCLDEASARAENLAPGGYVAFQVGDTGIGMSPEVVARAFDPFFTTKPIGMGTGLGLSMIYGFSQQSGGQVRLDSEPGKGTRVTLFLPSVLAQAEASEVSEPLELPRADGAQQVLVVDDEPMVRMLILDVLEELGYGALEAAEGSRALEILRSPVPIDLLISDVGLPGMNGRQLAEAARELRPDLKVLFITGYADNALVREGNLEPGMHVMTKPFAMEALAVRIGAIVASTSQ